MTISPNVIIKDAHQTYLRAFSFSVLGWNVNKSQVDCPEFHFFDNDKNFDAGALALGVAHGALTKQGNLGYPLSLKDFCEAHKFDFYRTDEGQAELRQKVVDKGEFLLKVVYPQVCPLHMVVKDLRDRFEMELMSFLQRRLYPTVHNGKPVPYDLDVRDLPDGLYDLYKKDPSDFKHKLDTGEITFVPKSWLVQHPDFLPKPLLHDRIHPHSADGVAIPEAPGLHKDPKC